MIISNTTPLINFAAIHRLDILKQLFSNIVIPQAVKKELLEKGKRYPSAEEIERAAFLETLKVQNVELCHSLKAELNEGEAEAIVLAIEHKAELLLIDEVEGRRVAKSHNIPFTGSIGCLIQAKRKRVISAIKPLLDEMQIEARFWIHADLYHMILEENDE